MVFLITTLVNLLIPFLYIYIGVQFLYLAKFSFCTYTAIFRDFFMIFEWAVGTVLILNRFTFCTG